MFKLVAICAVISVAFAQYGGNNYAQNEVTTPSYRRDYHPPAPVHYVNIGTQLAGDYKFGYDTGKGPLGQSFREETRLPDGTVKGAYGVLDESGRQRIIRYTAGKDGFKAEGDVGANGAPGVYPGPAPQPVANPHSAPAQSYQPAPQQYSPPAQQYNPPQQQYNPPQQQYNPPAQQYAAQPAARHNDGSWDPRKDDPYYQDGPAFIDVDRLSYNIGTARQGSAPQLVANSYTAPAHSYQPAPQRYNPPPRQYAPQPSARYNHGSWDPRKDDPYYQDAPPFIDVERLSYNIGTARRG